MDEYNKKHILVLTSTYQISQSGDIPGFVNRLCERISPNYKITVLTQHSGDEELIENIKGIEVHRFQYAPRRFELLSGHGGMLASIKRRPTTFVLIPIFVFAQVAAIRKLCKSIKPDIIHAHWIVPQGLAALLARKASKQKPPIVLTSHGGDLYGLSGALFGIIKKFVLNNVDCICVVSKSMKEYVRDVLGIDSKTVNVLPMGSELSDKFVPDHNRSRDRGTLLFVGRLVEKKGVSDLIRAFCLAKQKAPDLTLKIVGDGPDLLELKSLARNLELDETIEFVGSVSHDILPKYYQTAEAAVFPFVKATDGDMEGLGLVVVEAMGCETPVIVGDVPAIQDTVIDNKTGVIFRSGNYQDLAEKIIQMHSDPALRNRLGKNSRIYAQERFSWDVCADRYLKLFQEVLSNDQSISTR
ncbi:MAG: glycosyltransferase family 4 protein [Gammaproteobacteria bacterium]|nr:glycosyltransferase family 4 protein [Gammaproteobacteria bacterium]